VQPHQLKLYGKATRSQPREYFPWSTVTPQSQETLGALDLQSQRALYGSPVESAAQNELASTLRGDYLHGGPGFNRAFEAARNKITPMVQSQFEQAGRFGGGLAQEAETGALGDAFAGLYGQERQRQLAAQGFAPTISGLDYRNIGALSEVGAQREAFDREKLSAQIARHDFGQNEPFEHMMRQAQIIQGGFPGSTSTTQQPYYRNRLTGALGGGMAGLGAMGSLAASPLFGVGGVPGFAGLAGMGTFGAALPFMLGGAALGGIL
jgi:hypothetical protein